MTLERIPAVMVQRRNGAWIIAAYLNRLSEDSIPDDLFDAASSLPTAKRVARRMAQDLGFERGFRWEKLEPQHRLTPETWMLQAVLPPPEPGMRY